MKALFLLLMFWEFSGGLAHASNEASQVPLRWIAPKLDETSAEAGGKKMWVGVSGAATLFPGGLFGGSLAAGCQFHTLGLDLRAGYYKAGFGSISPPPSPADLVNAPSDSTAEVYRPRSGSDPWTMLEVEPGMSVTARFFREYLPQLSERARFGAGYGSFSDQLNALKFTGFLASFEGALQYQLNPKRPFAVEFAVNWHVGQISLSGQSSERDSQLSISYVTSALSLVYWF